MQLNNVPTVATSSGVELATSRVALHHTQTYCELLHPVTLLYFVVAGCLLPGDDHVVFWNHGSSVLTMNERVFVPHRSLSVIVDDDDDPAAAVDVVAYSLRLDSITLDDEGEYSCQVPAQPALIQRHEIVVNGQFV